MTVTVPGRRSECVLRRANPQKSQQQSVTEKKGEQYFISLSIKLSCGVCDIFHSSQMLQESTNLACNCRDTCKFSMLLLNLQALATLSSIQIRAEMKFRQCDQLFKGIGLSDLCYLAKGKPIKYFLSIMHSSFSSESTSIVDMFRVLCKHTRRCTLQAYSKDVMHMT